MCGLQLNFPILHCTGPSVLGSSEGNSFVGVLGAVDVLGETFAIGETEVAAWHCSAWDRYL